jgi:hypothetical protein
MLWYPLRFAFTSPTNCKAVSFLLGLLTPQILEHHHAIGRLAFADHGHLGDLMMH